MSELEGRGAAWTEERGTSDEGRRRPQSAPEASGIIVTQPAPALVALLANVRDPGNAGTVDRKSVV